jgi:beta-mannosidase
MSTTTELNTGWRWKQRNIVTAINDEIQQSGWTPVSAMPSEIHLELMKVGCIPDPYIASNEHKIQCKSSAAREPRNKPYPPTGVGERQWLYSTSFEFTPNEGQGFVELVFEGLDTLCYIYLVRYSIAAFPKRLLVLQNGTKLLYADNMFRPWTVCTHAVYTLLY